MPSLILEINNKEMSMIEKMYAQYVHYKGIYFHS